MQPGLRKVADAAFPSAQMPVQLVSDGFEVLCGYLSSPTNNGKNWTSQRIEACTQAGLGVGMFCEQFETIVLQGYSQANQAFGDQCERMANSFGYPDDCYMWYAVDTSPFGYEQQIVDSFRAYADTNHRPLGCYGGSQIIERLLSEGLIVAGHIPSAVAWSGTSRPYNGVDVFKYFVNGVEHHWYKTPLASMFQHNSEAYAGSRIDANDVLLPTPFWFPGEPDNPDPPKVLDVYYQIFQLPSGEAFGGYWDGHTAQEIVWLDLPTFLHYRDEEHYPVRVTQRAELTGSYLIGPMPPGFTAADFKWVSPVPSQAHGQINIPAQVVTF